jgi:hypothetical protein
MKEIQTDLNLVASNLRGGDAISINYVFGLVNPAPIINLPPETIRVKLRIRCDAFAQAFVKTPTGVSRWYLGTNHDGTFMLSHLVGANQRLDAKAA